LVRGLRFLIMRGTFRKYRWTRLT